MKKRRIPGIERLEARETPDVSLSSAAAYPVGAGAGSVAVSDAVRGSQAATSTDDPLQPVTDLTNLDAILAQDTAASRGLLSSHAVKTLFADAKEVDKLLACPSSLLETGKTDHAATAQPAEPLGWQFLYNYARKAIRNAELKYGSLADHEDMIHQVYVEWREQVGNGNKVYVDLLNQDSVERLALRKTVRRVIDHARYEQTRQRRMQELFDHAAPVEPGELDWRDLQIDWSLGVGCPGPRERQLLELRRQGMTFEEIGSEMGMQKQRVCEVYNSAVRRLHAAYGEAV
jgi:hypothetical protein